MKEPLIISIESALDVCSVAVSRGTDLLCLKEEQGQNIHSSRLTVFMQEAAKEANIEFKDLSAIAVSMGPGSYTGLRIGVSAAKGLAYALDKPVIGVNTLASLVVAAAAQIHEENMIFCPMIDARRMEVYEGLFNNKAESILPIRATIVDETRFTELLDSQKVVFFGNGMDKCRDILSKHENALFLEDIQPSARCLFPLALEKFRHGEFENLFTFEPFYLKDFMTTAPKRKPGASSEV